MWCPVGDEREGLLKLSYHLTQAKNCCEIGEHKSARPDTALLHIDQARSELKLVEARVGQLTQERDNAWAAAEQDRLWRESLLRRITELEAERAEALRYLESYCEATDPDPRADDGEEMSLPSAYVLSAVAVLSTSKEKTP